MVKFRNFLSVELILLILSNLYGQQSDNMFFPEIPIHIDSRLNQLYTLPAGFRRTTNESEAFYKLRINQDYKETSHNKLIYGVITAGIFILGYSAPVADMRREFSTYVGDPGNKDWDWKDGDDEWANHYKITDPNGLKAAIFGVRLLGGSVSAFLGGALAYGLGPDFTHHNYNTEIIGINQDGKKRTLKSWNEKEGASSNVPEVYPSYMRKSLKHLYKDNILKEKPIPNNMIVDILTERFKKWNELNSLLNNHKRSLGTSDIDADRRRGLSRLDKPRDEFESSIHYADRLKKEEIRKREIETQYQQALLLRKEQQLTRTIRLKRKLEDLAKEIEFEKTYDFTLSKYNPDKQKFSFQINKKSEPVFLVTSAVDNVRSGPSSKTRVIGKCYKGDRLEYIGEKENKWYKVKYYGEYGYVHNSIGRIINDGKLTKELFVSNHDARRFKNNSGKLIVKDVVRPSLDGQWVSVYDDVVLFDVYNGTVIPWEGDLPTYAAAPVTNPPSLSATVDLNEPSGEGYLDAEELASLKVTLTNNGTGPAKTTRISISQDSGPTLYYDISRTINTIAAGKSRLERFQITVPENVKNGQVKYTVSFIEAQGYEPEPVSFTAEVRAQRPPILTIVDFGVVDQDNDGKVSKGESAQITARIQNRGQGKAKKVNITVLDDPENNIFLAPYSKKQFNLGDIPAGEARDVTFTVLTNNRVGDMANIELKLDEKRPRFSKTELVKLEIDKQQKQLATLSFKGTSSDVAIANLATLTVEIEKDIPKGKKKNPDALAVVFGIESYKNVSDVTFAKRDATYMKEYFEKALGIPAKRIYYKTNDDVGKAEFDKVFSKDGWLDKRVKEGKTDLYIYYAGHGAPDIKKNKAYLIPYDGDPNYASQTGYEMDELYEQLGNLSARSTTVFLDACFTGANRESEILLAGARPVFMQVDASATRDVTVFSAAGGKEISSAWPEKKHGLFSYYLMKGMRGDADANKDKKITVGELGDYVKENVSDMAGMLDREQTPGLQTLDEKKVLIRY